MYVCNMNSYTNYETVEISYLLRVVKTELTATLYKELFQTGRGRKLKVPVAEIIGRSSALI